MRPGARITTEHRRSHTHALMSAAVCFNLISTDLKSPHYGAFFMGSATIEKGVVLLTPGQGMLSCSGSRTQVASFELKRGSIRVAG